MESWVHILEDLLSPFNVVLGRLGRGRRVTAVVLLVSLWEQKYKDFSREDL